MEHISHTSIDSLEPVEFQELSPVQHCSGTGKLESHAEVMPRVVPKLWCKSRVPRAPI